MRCHTRSLYLTTVSSFNPLFPPRQGSTETAGRSGNGAEGEEKRGIAAVDRPSDRIQAIGSLCHLSVPAGVDLRSPRLCLFFRAHEGERKKTLSTVAFLAWFPCLLTCRHGWQLQS
ncbi:hypothetical protein OPV22_003182 [Ensete ventricosum]|uniref:Uncharacterized protein n=1 Tax=Ensete ventricosum TaxID=4639 RepID=A0AAV8RZU4_ENSVE|nr:hypothetical protein OPV22_003182 [Ensete ventricosum]